MYRRHDDVVDVAMIIAIVCLGWGVCCVAILFISCVCVSMVAGLSPFGLMFMYRGTLNQQIRRRTIHNIHQIHCTTQTLIIQKRVLHTNAREQHTIYSNTQTKHVLKYMTVQRLHDRKRYTTLMAHVVSLQVFIPFSSSSSSKSRARRDAGRPCRQGSAFTHAAVDVDDASRRVQPWAVDVVSFVACIRDARMHLPLRRRRRRRCCACSCGHENINIGFRS